MSRVIISFLGAGSYRETGYLLPAAEAAPQVVVETSFVQVAIATAAVADGWDIGGDDRMAVCVTPEARDRNLGGLRAALLRVAGVRGFEVVELSLNGDGAEWGVFDAVVDATDGATSLILDITHAFRWMPLMASTVAAYLRQVRGVEVESILYGAFDPAKGERHTPIMDLRPMVDMNGWLGAMAGFNASGDFGRIADMTGEATRKARRAGGRGHLVRAANSARKTVGNLQKIMTAIRYCRGKRLRTESRKLAEGALRELPTLSQSGVRPLAEISERVERVLKGFCSDDHAEVAIHAARLCAEFDLVQQGMTILEESITTWVVDECIGREFWDDRYAREAVKAVFRNNDAAYGRGPIREPDDDRVREFMKPIDESSIFGMELVSLIKDTKQPRNDMNHFGINQGPRWEQALKSLLEDLVDRFEALVRERRSPGHNIVRGSRE